MCRLCGNRTYKGADLCSKCKPRPKQPRTDEQRARERAREHTRSYTAKQFPCASCGRRMWHGKGTRPPGVAICNRCRRQANTRPCVQCGEEFYSTSAEQDFCSHRCLVKHRGWTSYLEKPCEWCGKIFKGAVSRRCCSHRCGGLLRRQENDSWPRTRIWHMTCEECSRLFVTRWEQQKRCRTCPKPSWYQNLSEDKRAAHSKAISQRITERYQNDPAFRDKLVSNGQNRRVSKLGLEGITEPRQLLTWLYERDQGICGICGEDVAEGEKGPRKPSIDHIVPLSRGGLHIPANTQLAHYRCNLRKHNKMPEPWIVEAVRTVGGVSEGNP